MKIGLREINQHFSKYMRLIKEGKEVIVTERGTPIAVIKPIVKGDSPEERMRLLEDQGILRPAISSRFPIHKQITIGGRPLSEIVIEERESRY